MCQELGTKTKYVFLIISQHHIYYMHSTGSLLEHGPYALEKNMYSAAVGSRGLWVSVRSRWLIMLLMGSVLLVNLLLVVLSILKSEVLKFTTITVELPIAPFSFVSFYFMYFGAPFLTPYSFLFHYNKLPNTWCLKK